MLEQDRERRRHPIPQLNHLQAFRRFVILIGVTRQPFGLLELGSNSLKHYRVEPVPGKGHRIETRKVPWRIAHDYFTHGGLRESAVAEVLDALSSVASENRDTPMSGMLCLATGVFREFSDIGSLAARVKERTGLRLRVISGEDEAKLMAKSLPDIGAGSTVVADLGGATTEWAWIKDGKPREWGSLLLGAIRNHCAVGDFPVTSPEYLERSRQFCAAETSKLAGCGRCVLLVTGGTAKALARWRNAEVTSLAELREIFEEIHKNGPPESLKSERREVYLSGLVVLEQLMLQLQASELTYAQASVREGMARRLVALLASRGGEDLHSTLLLHTTSTMPREVDGKSE